MFVASDGGRSGAIYLIILLVFSSVSPWSHAAGLAVKVVDAAGSSVEQAVISLHAEFALDSTPAVGTEVIDQQDRQFRPWVSAVTVGDQVVFANSDEITHHVYSFSPTRRFSFRLQSGERRPAMSMDRPGVVVLGCNIHDWMVGYVFVSDGTRVATTDDTGMVRFTNLPAGRWRVAAWHPGLKEADRPTTQVVDLLTGSTSRAAFRFSSPLNERGPRKPLSDGAYGAP